MARFPTDVAAGEERATLIPAVDQVPCARATSNAAFIMTATATRSSQHMVPERHNASLNGRAGVEARMGGREERAEAAEKKDSARMSGSRILLATQWGGVWQRGESVTRCQSLKIQR